MDTTYDVSWERLAPYACTYVLLPLILFCLFWLRPSAGFILAALTVASLILSVEPRFIRRFPKIVSLVAHDGRLLGNPIIRTAPCDDVPRLSMSGKVLLALLVVAVVWCFFGGQGGCWYQSGDWSARNAVLDDLITRSWPVYYNDGSNALVYYICYWLPVASLGHGLFLITGDAGLCCRVGDILLLVWSSAGIFMVELLIANVLRVASGKRFVFAVALLVLFSGMDIVGVTILTIYDGQLPSSLWMGLQHLEPWARWYQYSSNTTLLFWVFNQTVIAWICTCALLLSRNVSNFVVIVAACFASSPFAGVGLALVAIALGAQALVCSIRDGIVMCWVRSVLSLQNLAIVLPALAIASYFLCTGATSAGSGQPFSGGIVENIMLYVLFFALEVGCYLLVLLSDYRRCTLYWTIVASLVVIPCIQVGTNGDFCMRASIPALFILMLMCARFTLEHAKPAGNGKPLMRANGGRVRKHTVSLVLAACLTIGAITPAVEFARGFYSVGKVGIAASVQAPDDIEGDALGGDHTKNVKVAVDGNAFFFRWLAGG